jgi:hypothetical protein
MRKIRLLLLCLGPALAGGRAFAWSEPTHQKMTSIALKQVDWLDHYGALTPTRFERMIGDVLGEAAPVTARDFRFFGASKRASKLDGYLRSTDVIADPAVRQFARHFLLSNQIQLSNKLGEGAHAVSARDILGTYVAEPDWGMDKGLDASWHQAVMGGTNGAETSSQGFRHMSFLLNHLGEATLRAPLFAQLAERAFQKGHPYWGFRFLAWSLHYIEDLGTPPHTNLLPTLKYIRFRDLLSASPVRAWSNLVKDTTRINSAYHYLYENYAEATFQGRTPHEAETVALEGALVQPPGWGTFGEKLLAPRSVHGVARRRAWSRLSTPGIANHAIAFFGSDYRTPPAGEDRVRLIDYDEAARAIPAAEQPRAGEPAQAYARRLRARDAMIRSTVRQFERTGVAVRRAVGLFQKGARVS